MESMAVVRPGEAEMVEVSDTRFEEFAARIEERLGRVDEKSDERFERLVEQIARVDGKTEERFDGLAEQIDRVDEKGQERFSALAEEVVARFAGVAERVFRVDEKSDQRAVEVDRRLSHLDRESERINDRLDSLVRVIVVWNISLTYGIIAGFIAIVGLILTQS